MLKKVLFNAHWIIGITLGTALAFSGLSGGLMAFGPEITGHFLGAGQRIEPSGGAPLDAVALYEKVRDGYPGRRVSQLYLYDDASQPARVKYAPSNRGFTTGPFEESRLANPYTGELLPERAVGRKVEYFMSWLREVHQGHWGSPGGVGSVAANVISYGTLALFLVAISGLYLRWPKGIAKKKWQSWLVINGKLKGRAFLWSMHSVLGTLALLLYLVFAHTGTFMGSGTHFYGDGVRAMLGLPVQARPPPPGGGGPGGPQGMGPAGPQGFGGEGPPGGFPGAGPGGGSGVTIFYMGADSFENARGDITGARTARFNPLDGSWREQPLRDTSGFARTVADENQNIHEGRYFGTVGVILMMLAAFCMPVFFVTGWMMYLKRRKAKAKPLATGVAA